MTMFGRIHIVLCSVPISAVLEINTASFKRLRHIQVRYRMEALADIYTLRKQTLHSPNRCRSRKATSAKFLEVQLPLHVFMHDSLGSIGVVCQTLDACKKLVKE